MLSAQWMDRAPPACSALQAVAADLRNPSPTSRSRVAERGDAPLHAALAGAAAAVLEVPEIRDLSSRVAEPCDQVLRLAFECCPAPAMTATRAVLTRELLRVVVESLLGRVERDRPVVA